MIGAQWLKAYVLTYRLYASVLRYDLVANTTIMKISVVMNYIPITILFAIVLLFRLNEMSPALNANIFFCQIVSSPAVMSLLSVYVYFSEQTPIDPQFDII